MTTLANDTDRATLLSSWRAQHRPDLAAHLAYHGPLPLPPAADRSWAQRFAGAIEQSGLTGRGGASFPSGAKLEVVRSARGRPVLVVNAMEGEPGSTKDEVLLTHVPHLVLDGSQLAATALRARRIVMCVPDNKDAMAGALGRAVSERAYGALAPVDVDIARPPGRYVTGEESALVSWLSGRPAAPTFRLRKGEPLRLGRAPTLVHNAETLAHMALIARYGPAAFRAAGLADAPGTCLVTVSGAVAHPGVYEIPQGSAIREIVARPQPRGDVAAILVGGFGGTWLSNGALDTPYAPGPLASVGAAMGPGVIVVFPRDGCGIAEAARIASYMAGESAAQCGPCVFGLPAIADDLARLARGNAGADTLRRLEMRFDAVDGRGACRHPDGAVRMARSALSVFAADAAAHARRSPCPYRDRPSVLSTTTAHG